MGRQGAASSLHQRCIDALSVLHHVASEVLYRAALEGATFSLLNGALACRKPYTLSQTARVWTPVAFIRRCANLAHHASLAEKISQSS